MHADSELTDDEATDLVIREIRMHLEEGRKNFVLRAPQQITVYLLSGLLESSGLSMVALERLMSEQEISGIRSSHDGRVLRRYMSGETRMSWPIYRRMIFGRSQTTGFVCGWRETCFSAPSNWKRLR